MQDPLIAPAAAQGSCADTEAWLLQALATPGTSHFVETPAGRLHYLAWNEQATELPGILLVHGYRAHAHYWDAVAPSLASSHRVVAMDLAGMGDSAPRANYDASGFAQDILAVIRAAQLAPAIVVGHSYGGARALRAAHDQPEGFRQVIAIDSICRIGDGREPPPAPSRFRVQPFEDLAAATARFRLVPTQPCPHAFLMDHVARHSVRPVEGGWWWKFDPALPPGPHEGDMSPLLARLRTPVTYLRGEHSEVMPQGLASAVVARLPNAHGPVELRGSYHYPMLDQPLGLVRAMRGLMA